MIRKILFILTCLCLFLTFLGCEIDYEAGSVVEDLDNRIPDYRITNLIQTQVKSDGSRIIIEADKAEDFRKREETSFYNVDLKEWDSNNKIIRTGEANLGIIKDNNDAILQGDIVIYSDIEKTTVKGDFFKWSDSEKLLSGSEEGTVSLIEEEGSTVSGKGFVGDFSQNIITFRYGIKGSIQFEEKNSDQEEESE